MLRSPHHALDLSFMRRNPGGSGIDYWNVQTAGPYSVPGNYTTDCEAGRRLSEEYLAYIGKHPSNGNATLLGCIALAMIEKNAAKGLVLGFMAGVNEYSMSVARLLFSNADMVKPAPVDSGEK